MKKYKPKYINTIEAVQFWPRNYHSEVTMRVVDGKQKWYLKLTAQGRDFGDIEIFPGNYLCYDPILGWDIIEQSSFEATYEEVKD